MEESRESRFKEYSRAAVFSILGAPILTYITCNRCAQDVGNFILTASISAMTWFVMWVGNGELSHFISVKIPWVKYPIKRLIVGIITTIVFTVVVAWGLMKLFEYSKGIRFTNFYDFILIALVITFLISLFLHSREFLLQWRRTAVEAERYQKESISAQYESLKNQVNPHFLFNSLNVLSNLVHTDQDKATAFIKKMSDVYRYVLDTRNQELVNLQEEMAFAESYIYLQQIRFGNNLKVNVQLNGKSGKVVPLAIQMLIENAIKHNEISTEKPLTITIKYEQPFICVENKVQLRSSPLDINSGVGLENIKKRYEFLNSDSVQVIKSNGMFTVKIPVIIDNPDD